jgi:hypothetical protein
MTGNPADNVEAKKMADPNPNANVNSSIDRRREERQMADQLGQEAINRVTELTAGQLAICQAQIAFVATAAHYLGDSFNAIAHAMSQMIQQTERARDEAKRRA